jgi:hypothetical protein
MSIDTLEKFNAVMSELPALEKRLARLEATIMPPPRLETNGVHHGTVAEAIDRLANITTTRKP